MEDPGRRARRQSPRPMGPSFSSEGSMPTERLSMRKIRDVLRLKFERGLSERVIARSMSLSNGSVNSYLQRARMAGLRWPLPDDLDDGALERLLFPPAATAERRAHVPGRVGRTSTRKCGARASLWRCCGRNIAPHIRTGLEGPLRRSLACSIGNLAIEK